jgi:hypothetical protein
MRFRAGAFVHVDLYGRGEDLARPPTTSLSGIAFANSFFPKAFGRLISWITEVYPIIHGSYARAVV